MYYLDPEALSSEPDQPAAPTAADREVAIRTELVVRALLWSLGAVLVGVAVVAVVVTALRLVAS